MASTSVQLNADAEHSAHSVTSPVPADLPREALSRLLSEVGLSYEEYRIFVERLGRQPNKVELGMAGAMSSLLASRRRVSASRMAVVV